MLECDHIVIPTSYNWGKIVALRYGFNTKLWGDAWERDLSSDIGIDSAIPAGRECTRPSYRTRVPKYVYFLNLPTLSSRQAVDPTPTSTPASAPTAGAVGLVGLWGSSSFVLSCVH